jgi:hypothetical protein
MDKEALQKVRDSIETKCEVCAKPQAKYRKFRKVTGVLVISHMQWTKPHCVCDQHKRHFATDSLIHDLLLGWWGIYAFFWNIYALLLFIAGGEDCTNEIKDAMIVYQARISEAIAKQEALKQVEA